MPHVPHPLLAARSRLREAWACGDGEFQTQRSIDSEWFWLLWHILIIFVCLNWYVRPKDSRDSRDSGKVGRFSDWAFGSESTFKTQGPGNFADIFHPLLDHVNPFTPSGRLWPTTPERHEKTMYSANSIGKQENTNETWRLSNSKGLDTQPLERFNMGT